MAQAESARRKGADKAGGDRWAAARARLRRLGWRRSIGIALLALVLIAAGAVGVAVARLPDLDEVAAQSADRLSFRDINGEPLVVHGAAASTYAELERMPQSLIDAVLAIEDRRFYDHGGIDLRSVARAMMVNAAEGRIVQGGSTISQQLIKVRYLSPERTWRRKLHEALLTRQLEDRFTKDEILERYLNSVYMGSGATGMPAAARAYFAKEVEDLALSESAALAAMIRAPSVVNAYADLDALRTRAGTVLDAMLEDGRIDAGAANAARVELSVLEPRRALPPYGAWFSDWALPRARQIAEDFEGPVTIRTTLDPALQVLAEKTVAQAMRGQPMQAALVALRPDGTVAAMVGGRNYLDSQFNRATQALRPPGSTFKVFVYLAALDAGLSPDDRIPDRPLDIDGYSPENFDGRYRGEVTMTQALASSLNAATVELAQNLGIDRVAAAARALGVNAELSETPALALGASGVTLIDMVEAYAALATGRGPVHARGLAGIRTGADGAYHPFRWSDGSSDSEAAQLLEHREALTAMLRAAVTDGTGSAAETPAGSAGKTGTSQDNRDALFIGWSGELIVGVWVGNDDNTPMQDVTGGGLPAQIFAAFQTAAADAGETAARSAPPAPDSSAAVATRGTSQPGTDLPDPQTLAEKLEAALSQAREPTASCNIRACERHYRSFRASDCTFQPYGGGPRKLCTR